MRILSWKHQGVGNPSTVRALKYIVQINSPGIFFLMETKLTRGEFNDICRCFGSFNSFNDDSNGRRAGLALFWNKILDVNIFDFSTNHIVFDAADKKQGGHIRDQRELVDFLSTIDERGVADLGYDGHAFTWTNRRTRDQLIQVRLDRFLANSKWQDVYSDWQVWMRREGFDGFVVQAWGFDGAGHDFMDKVRECGASLQAWAFDNIGSIQKKLKKKTEEVKAVHCREGSLNQIFCTKEITQALKQMGPSKAPGPDGMSVMFYNSYWHVVGNDVISYVHKFLRDGVMPTSMNHTNIVLIPKSAFVPGRLITDNALVAFEVFHSMAKISRSRRGTMALKLDMSKASVSFSAMINGNPHGRILPQQGLRQGDPLSPYLFFLCTEDFSAMLRKEVEEGRLSGGITIVLCLLKANIHEGRVIKEVIKGYERASGQMVNFDKLELMFSSGTHRDLRSDIGSILGIREVPYFEKYLVLPKQVWHLFHYPDSLCGKVFRAKYYLRTDVLNALVNRRFSYVWQSFLEGERFYCQVWLGVLEMGVGMLAELEKFSPKKMQPIFRKFLLAPDCLPTRWECLRLDRLTISSQIRRGVQTLALLAGMCTQQCGIASGNYLIPPKVKNFLWRISHNTLACKVNLIKIKLLISALCPRCHTVEESAIHCIKECEEVQGLWLLSPLNLRVDRFQCSNAQEWLALMFSTLKREEAQIFVMALWLIWMDRNNIVFGNLRLPLPVMFTCIFSFLSTSSNEVESRIVMENNVSSSWSPCPICGRLFGVEFQFFKGAPMLKLQKLRRSFLVYLLPGTWASTGVICEMDALNVTSKLCNPNSAADYLQMFVDDCLAECVDRSVSIVYAKRSCNQVVHALGQVGDFLW
ncbi:uncharacterized protein LOC126668536 [Mercurialis annua]|uniref:uncharacterized protein LOC126668536 n=1 Tax=Mercurialis annua TaxID=3986 RepID=UPI00215FD83B|nr:uncharacterized protein LOC126668536 [Mercurialis annua]